MTNIITTAIVVLALLLSGCTDKPYEWPTTPIELDRTPRAYEDGLRAGHADAKKFGFCDHPFPREESFSGYGTLYLNRFEGGYWKGCAIARKSSVAAPKKKAMPPTLPPPSKPATSRCEA
jgi:hypothetical protein